MSYTNREFTWDLDKLREFFLYYVLAPLRSLVGYYECGTAASQAAKTVAAVWYSTIREGGSMKIKFTYKNTAASGVTLKIGSATAKPLYYGGAAVDATNTWDDGETVEVYYDGTRYYANNVAGGSGSGDGAFDVSAKYPTSGVEGGNTYTLAGALAVLNTNLSANKKKGGMSIKFIESSDNKYVQYRLVKNEWSAIIEDWQEYILSDRFNNMWYEKQDTSSITITQNYGIVAVAGANLGITTYNAVVSCTDFIDISNADGGTVKVSVLTVPTTAANVGIVFYNEEQSPIIGYNFIGEQYNQLHEIVIPQNAKYIRTTLWKDTNTYGGLEVYFLKAIKSIPTELVTIENRFLENEEVHTNIYNVIDQLKEEMQNDKVSCLMFDALQTVRSCDSTNTNLGPFEIVSSTENTITVDSTTYGYLSNFQPLCVEFSAEVVGGYKTYKVLYFNKIGDNTLELSASNPESVDLSNSLRCASIHDTLNGGNGQHLSPFGYRALACSLADSLTKKDCYNYKNYKIGFISFFAKTNAWNEDKIYNSDGTVLIYPKRIGTKNGGYFPAASGYSNKTPIHGRVSSNSEFVEGLSDLSKQFVFFQYREDINEVSIELPFSCNNINGYLVIEGNTSRIYPGTATLEVIADGIVIFETTMKDLAQKYVIGLRKWNNFSVKISIAEIGKVTCAYISSICLYEMYPNFNYPNFSGKKIAFLGNSWTQFNGVDMCKDWFGNDDPDCELIGNYPDGTTRADGGCGIFPKYFGHLTGAVVDNWGLNGASSANHGLTFIDRILNYADYDYILIEFFINDLNSGTTKAQLKQNLKELAQKALKKNVQPIIMMPCGTASYNQTFNMAEMNQYLLKGLFIE